MIKYTVLLVALIFVNVSAHASTATPDILASVSSNEVSMLSIEQMNDTRGESVTVSAAIRLCEIFNLSFCEVSLNADAGFVSLPLPLPFGLGVVYLQQ